MGKKVFSNNASTTLASSLSSTASSCAATSGGGSLFPALTGGNTFQMTFSKIVGGAVTAQEIVTVTARTGDVFTITRAQEGTTALAWNAGDTMQLLPTAGSMNAFAQASDLQAQAGSYAQDTGTANAYVAAVTPTLTAHLVGAPIVWRASNGNTGASTFSDGFGVGNMLANAAPTLPGMIVAGAIYETVWDGANFNLTNPSSASAVITNSFTATLTGVSGSVTGPINYSVIPGFMATLGFPFGNQLLGASNSTTMTITGLPAILQPKTAEAIAFCNVEDNGFTGCIGAMYATPGSGTLHFFLCSSLSGTNPVTLGAQSPFTSSGTKGLPTQFAATYPLF